MSSNFWRQKPRVVFVFL